MIECKKCESLFEKALNDELGIPEKKEFDEHLVSCGNCSEKFEDLKAVLNLAKTYKRQEPDERFMENFWETLEPKIKYKGSQIRSKRLMFPKVLNFVLNYKYQLAGGLALLILGFFIGRYLTTGNQNTTASNGTYKTKTQVNETAVNAQVSKYLDRSKILLLGITNFDPAKEDTEVINLKDIKVISRHLANQAVSLKRDLNEPSQQQLKRLVSNLELIMLQIANLETKHDRAGIELIKDLVSSKGIFLKINIQELNESTRGNNNPRSPARQTNKDNKNI